MPKLFVLCLALLPCLLCVSAVPARQGELVLPTRPGPAARPAGLAQPDQLSEAAAWASPDGQARLFLVRRGHGRFSLFVAGGRDLRVTYRTRRNSSQDVVKTLEPVADDGGCLREYRFSHTFSRTTIWMALEFSQGGKPLPELGRGFTNGIRPGLAGLR